MITNRDDLRNLISFNQAFGPNRTRLLESQINSISTPQTDGGLASKGYIVHLAMYGASLMGELNELRR